MNRKKLVDNVIIVVAVLAWFGMGALYLYLPKQREVVYNCSISEISPDYPIEVKEGCRKLRMDKIK